MDNVIDQHQSIPMTTGKQRTLLIQLLILLASACPKGTAFAQESPEGQWSQTLWASPASNRLYMGMWSYHFHHKKEQDWNNQLLAFSHQGFYGGTFINTHGDRVVTAGVQRAWLKARSNNNVRVEVGYRLGMMYGYTRYLTLFGTRFYPLLQVITDIDYQGFGIELSWAGVVTTVGFSIRF